MNENTQFRLGFRLGLAILSLVTIVTGHLLDIIEKGATFFDIIASYRFFTMQSNLFVLIWLVLAIYYNNSEEKLQRIMGPIKGAITSYITVTFFVFAILLAPLFQPTGFDAFSNLMLHYFIPIAFIMDWVLFENRVYDWKYIPVWFIYPVAYIIFAVILGLTTNDYIYPFFNLNSLGTVGIALSITGLAIFYLILSGLYIGITRIKNKW